MDGDKTWHIKEGGCVSDVSIMEVDMLERHMDSFLNGLVPVLLCNSLIYEL
jgi:hypothetical protein